MKDEEERIFSWNCIDDNTNTLDSSPVAKDTSMATYREGQNGTKTNLKYSPVLLTRRKVLLCSGSRPSGPLVSGGLVVHRGLRRVAAIEAHVFTVFVTRSVRSKQQRRFGNRSMASFVGKLYRFGEVIKGSFAHSMCQLHGIKQRRKTKNKLDCLKSLLMAIRHWKG